MDELITLPKESTSTDRDLAHAASVPHKSCMPQLKMYQQIYFSVIAALALVMLTTFACLHFVISPGNRKMPAHATLAKLVGDSLPPANAPATAQAAAIQDWIDRTQADISLYTAERRLMYGGGSRTLAAPPAAQAHDGWTADGDSIYAAQLPDKRWLVLTFERGEAAEHITVGVTLFLIFLMVGLGIYPVVRKITGRLEELQRNVNALGEGNLAVRVTISGADEVGSLARSFNRTASQLESMVQAQKSLLGNASHELRSPLARIQMALGLFCTEGGGVAVDEGLAVDEIHQSVRELDQLVGEILLASRLESGWATPALAFESFELAAFLDDACAPFTASVLSAALSVEADRALMKRLMRNLLENARRYGGTNLIEVTAQSALDGTVEIRIADRGPGIPPSAQKRIFEPFYRSAGASESDGGVGLGLSIVQSIARLHRGTVYCSTRSGGGSVFIVRIPQHGDRELGAGRS